MILQIVLQLLFASLVERLATAKAELNVFERSENLELSHFAILDPNNMINLRWKYNSTYIIFQIKANTTGWIGMGVSPKGSMAGSDMAVMWIKDGKTNLFDTYAEYNSLPKLDSSQDLQLISSAITDDQTIVTFGRKLRSCDEQDNDISENTLRVIYAWGDHPPSGDFLTANDKHKPENRGSKSIRLLSQQMTYEPSDKGLKTKDMLNDKVEIPAKQTYYHCKIQLFKLNKRKHHIVKIEPIIQKGNELYVHHMVIYICKGLPNNSTIINDHGQECYNENMPLDYKKCNNMIFAWAIGGGAFVYPDKVGMPLDDSHEDVYIMTEMHYDNQNEDAGVIDSSGIRWTYTEHLREIDSGILEVGKTANVLHYIPAKQKNWKTLAECSGECVAKAMPKETTSLKIFAVMLHAHLFGIQLKLRHYRNSVELKPLSSEEYYDFNYQEYNVFEKEIEYMKGDSLVMECIYDTSKRDKPVFGGLGTDEEMCLAFIQYYPKIEVSMCLATINIVDVSKNLEMDVNETVLTNFTAWQKEYLKKVNSSDFSIKDYNANVLETRSFYTYCNGYSVTYNETERQNITATYNEPNCEQQATTTMVTTTSSATKPMAWSQMITCLILLKIIV